MPRSNGVPPMRRPAKGTDVLIPTAEPVSEPETPAHVKTSYYLRPDQMELLDSMQAAFRKAGMRTVNASLVVRAALDVALEHEAEWDQAIERAAR